MEARMSTQDEDEEACCSSSSPAPAPAPAPSAAAAAAGGGGCSVSCCTFRAYRASVEWHGGVRAFLCGLVPRYGHYCGPNWSSGRSRGSLLWDLPPIDALDLCCFCHDVAYDTHHQARLHAADLRFLRCLSALPPPPPPSLAAALYRTACIIGLRTVLLPYRRMLLQIMEAQAEARDKSKKKKTTKVALR